MLHSSVTVSRKISSKLELSLEDWLISKQTLWRLLHRNPSRAFSFLAFFTHTAFFLYKWCAMITHENKLEVVVRRTSCNNPISFFVFYCGGALSKLFQFTWLNNTRLHQHHHQQMCFFFFPFVWLVTKLIITFTST